ncbi:NUDIX domain-containing protein [Filobacillus milosensis]|uniref:NUDIX domain-containing protein n=1 Tax=Filobacillus milosensis TaxID=94137 RepID=A0A4Y8IE88_9BACI|nr:NUDIX hydrolase [Filobacillus milosensis]TFB13112.1 NUDIX domain-containing protein [Filobacillus milosensis]
MNIRLFAAAYLINENQEILFLQKQNNARFLAGHLVPIGGHMEDDEVKVPLKACYREIEEETGLQPEQITNLKFKYIMHRIKENEIRIQYLFFGNVSRNLDLIESEEGELKWIKPDDIDHLEMTAATKEIIKHYISIGQLTDDIYVGTMGSSDNKPEVNWGILRDWEI